MCIHMYVPWFALSVVAALFHLYCLDWNLWQHSTGSHLLMFHQHMLELLYYGHYRHSVTA